MTNLRPCVFPPNDDGRNCVAKAAKLSLGVQCPITLSPQSNPFVRVAACRSRDTLAGNVLLANQTDQGSMASESLTVAVIAYALDNRTELHPFGGQLETENPERRKG